MKSSLFTQKATVRIRPLRFAFALDPHDLSALLRVFEANSVLWGGDYNFILPLFKRVPRRYVRPYEKEIRPAALIEGLLEAFQPDFLVEVESGSTAGLSFPRGRVISLDQLLTRDDQNRCSYGVDVRSIIAHLYKKAFRFVQRHPPETVLASCTDNRYNVLFAAIFGVLPNTGPLADCADHFLKGLDGKRKAFAPEEYPKLLNRKYLYPLNLGGLDLRRETVIGLLILSSITWMSVHRSILSTIGISALSVGTSHHYPLRSRIN